VHVVGEEQVTCVAEFDPKRIPLTFTRLVPVMVTKVPPFRGPDAGLIRVTVGATLAGGVVVGAVVVGAVVVGAVVVGAVVVGAVVVGAVVVGAVVVGAVVVGAVVVGAVVVGAVVVGAVVVGAAVVGAAVVGLGVVVVGTGGGPPGVTSMPLPTMVITVGLPTSSVSVSAPLTAATPVGRKDTSMVQRSFKATATVVGQQVPPVRRNCGLDRAMLVAFHGAALLFSTVTVFVVTVPTVCAPKSTDEDGSTSTARGRTGPTSWVR
jgi:hypothetical protein